VTADETPSTTAVPERVVGLTLTRRPVRIAGMVIAAGVIAVLNGAVASRSVVPWLHLGSSRQLLSPSGLVLQGF